jgi:hypothetical protein
MMTLAAGSRDESMKIFRADFFNLRTTSATSSSICMTKIPKGRLYGSSDHRRAKVPSAQPLAVILSS